MRHSLDGLIVFANRPKKWDPKFLSQAIEATGSFGMSPARRKASLRRLHQYKNGLRQLRESGVPYLILWGSGAITAFTRDAKTIARVAKNAYDETIKLFERAGA